MLRTEKLKTASSAKIKKYHSNSKRIILRVQQKGSILIGLIITMVIMASLGAGMLYVTTTSTYQEIMANNHTRAFYAAESGGRYAMAVIRNAFASGSPSTDTDYTNLKANAVSGSYTLVGNTFKVQNIIESDVVVPGGTTKQINFDVIGVVNSSSFLQAQRKISYRIQPANQPGGGGCTGSNCTTDITSASQLTSLGSDWGTPSVSSNVLIINVPGGGAAEDRAEIGYNGSSLAGSWTAAGGLSYDAQVKVKVDPRSDGTPAYFLAGLVFRVSGGTTTATAPVPGFCTSSGCTQPYCSNWKTDKSGSYCAVGNYCTLKPGGVSFDTTIQSMCLPAAWTPETTTTTSTTTLLQDFGLSFMRNSDNVTNYWLTSNTDNIPTQLVNFVTEQDWYIVLWMEDPDQTLPYVSGHSYSRIIAFKKLSANSGVTGPVQFFDDMEKGESQWNSTHPAWTLVNTESSSPTHSWKGVGSSIATLTFWHKWTAANKNDSGVVEMTNNNWATSTVIKTYTTNNTGLQSFPVPSNFQLASAVQVRFRVHSTTNNSKPVWNVDDVDIQVNGVSKTPFPDNMENGGGNWTTTSGWSIVTRNYNSPSHSWEGTLSAGSPPSDQSLTSVSFSLADYSAPITNGALTSSTPFTLPASATLSFMHKLTAGSNVNVLMCTGTTCPTGGTWTTIGNVTGSDNSWQAQSFPIITNFLSHSNVYVRFNLSSSTTTFQTGYIDDVMITTPSFTPWSTLLVRIQEKTLTSSDSLSAGMPVGTRVNDIRAYYSTPTSNPLNNTTTGHTVSTDVYRTGSNPVDTKNWPAGTSGVVNNSVAAVSDPNFTLIQWDWVRPQTLPTGYGNLTTCDTTYTKVCNWHQTFGGVNDDNFFAAYSGNTIVRTKYNTTPSTGTFGTRSEVGLSAFGHATHDINKGKIYFDDFSVRAGGGGGGTDGNGSVVESP